MSVLMIAAEQASVVLGQADPNTGGGSGNGGGGWDLLEMLTSGQDYGTKIMGGLLALIGTIAIGWAGVQAMLKLFSSGPNGGGSWMKIIGLLFLGGLALFGGFALFSSIASGAKDTVDEFGGNGSVASASAPAWTTDGQTDSVFDGDTVLLTPPGAPA